MGTRGLLGFIIKGVRKGTFNRWDSYPEGIGKEMVDFIMSLDDEACKLMVKRLEEVRGTSCLCSILLFILFDRPRLSPELDERAKV